MNLFMFKNAIDYINSLKPIVCPERDHDDDGEDLDEESMDEALIY